MSSSLREVADRVFGPAARASAPRPVRWELGTLLLLAALALARNLAFLVRGLGEQDAARLIDVAHFWRLTGWLPFVNYTDKTSPAWLWMLKSLMAGGVSDAAIIGGLNVAAAFAGVAVAVLAYLLARRLAGPVPALMTAAFITVSPAVAIFSLYGFPTIFAYAGFLLSVLLVDRMLVASGRRAAVHALAAAAVLASACAVKADIILFAGAYPALAFLRGRLTFGTILLLAAIGAAGAVAPLIFRALFIPAPIGPVAVPREVARQWDDRFPFSISQLLSRENLSITGRSSGYVLTALAIVSGVLLCVGRESRRMAVFILLWALPVILFWGGRPGNSARHLLGTTFPLSLAAAILIDRVRQRVPARGVAVGLTLGAIGLNYVSAPASSSSIAPSPRFVASVRLLRVETEERMMLGRPILHDRLDRVFLIDSFTQPYTMYTLLRDATALRVVRRNAEGDLNEGVVRTRQRDGRFVDLAWVYVRPPLNAQQLAREASGAGWTVYSVEASGLPGQTDRR